MIADGLTRDLAAELGIDAQLNGQRLVRSARLLADAGDFPGGFSMAMTAREEVAKMMLAFSFLMGQTTAQRLAETFWSHSRKQGVGLAFSHIAEHLTASEALVSLTVRGKTIEDAFKDFAGHADRLAVHAIESQLDLPALELRFEAAWAATDEVARQNSIYVSLDDRDGTLQVVSPSRVTEKECRDAIREVEPLLSGRWGADFEVDIDELNGHKSKDPMSRAEYKAFLLRAFSATLFGNTCGPENAT